jgi:hypothetical protein
MPEQSHQPTRNVYELAAFQAGREWQFELDKRWWSVQLNCAPQEHLLLYFDKGCDPSLPLDAYPAVYRPTFPLVASTSND